MNYWIIIKGFSSWIWFFINPFYRKKMEKLFSSRLSICESCKFFKTKTRQCKKCGCFCDAKVKVIYKLNKDNLAIYDNKYVCEEKKW